MKSRRIRGDVVKIGGKTKVIAILGDPVEHSRSPAMHNAAFAALGLDYVYVALRVDEADLRRAITGVRALGISGLNVTVPHKEKILPLLDRLTPRARAIGAVNTVTWKGSDLCGDNTDAEGFLMAVRKMGFRPRGRSAIVLGAGGSARAVVWALARSGVRSLRVLNRTPEKARSLRPLVHGQGGIQFSIGSLEAASDAKVVGGADLVVNCTSLGLDGRSHPPFRVDATPAHCMIYDLVYGPNSTSLVRTAAAVGRRAEDGRGMLLHQAGLAFRLWTGRRPPLEVMAAALGSSEPPTR